MVNILAAVMAIIADVVPMVDEMISVWAKSHIGPTEKNLMEQGPLSGMQLHWHCKTVSANVCLGLDKETMVYCETKYNINSRYPTRSFSL